MLNIFRQIIPRVNIMLINQVSALITIPWVAHKFSNEMFGFVATAIIILQFSWMIIQWGYQHYVTEIWRQDASQLSKNILVTQILASQIFLAFVFLVFMSFLIHFSVINLPTSLFAYLILAIISGGILPLWFFNLHMSSERLVPITFLSRLIFLFCVFSLVNGDEDAQIFILLHALSFFIITGYAIWVMYVSYKFRIYLNSGLSVFNHTKKCFPFFINSITNNQTSVLWSLILSIGATNPFTIGLYSIAEHAYRAGGAISDTVAQVARVNLKNKSKKESLRFAKMTIGIYFIFLCIGLFIIKPSVKLIFNDDYLPVIPILQIMILAWFFQSCSKIMGYSILGQIISFRAVNHLGFVFLILHILMMCSWLYYDADLLTLTLLLLFLNFLHILIMLIAVRFPKLLF
jgi:O-antigen/teichoic acid export membrane protein